MELWLENNTNLSKNNKRHGKSNFLNKYVIANVNTNQKIKYCSMGQEIWYDTEKNKLKQGKMLQSVTQVR